uniref:C2H2-type domain-containing protein n=1 Tax=Cuerna arida TaxID=1464854 RepID=A0A1B6FKH9_9HEMI
MSVLNGPFLCRYVKGVHQECINSHYFKLQHKFNFDGIKFPTPLSQVKKFEKSNPNVSVNVYTFNESEEIYPLKVCNKELKEHFDLLLFTNDVGVSHYCYIKNFSRLVRSQFTSYTRQVSFCKRCFKHFQGSRLKTQLKNHMKDCISHKPVKVVMPADSDDSDEPSFLSFLNFHFMYPVPIIAYCDFESILKKPVVEEKLSQHVTVKSIHEPMSFCVYFAYDTNGLSDEVINSLPNDPYLYRGPNSAGKFVEYIVSMSNLIGDILDVNKKMLPLTQEEKDRIKLTTHCKCCHSEFTETFNQPCKDHCHLTGRFRSVLCYSYNLKRQNQKYLPVVIHGSSNYDSHFIIKHLGCDKKKLK